MAGKDKVTLEIDIDTKDAAKKANGFVQDLNDSLGSLVKNYGFVATAAAGVGFAIKEAFDVAREIAAVADETNKVNKTFDIIASNAGASGSELRAAFENLNQGILDTEDILKAATTALVNLNLPAQDIAKNFEAARRISVAMGTDTQQAFEAINTAIASGNTRALKQVGIFLDAKSAIENYAQSVGVASKFLTDAQKEAALFNAIQSKINQSFGSVDIATKTTSESFKSFSTAAKDLGEAVAIGLNKIFGPSVQGLLGKFSDGLSLIANQILVRLGSETEKAAASQGILNEKVERLAYLRNLIQKDGGIYDNSGARSEIAALESIIKKQTDLKQVQADRAQAEEDRFIKFASKKKQEIVVTEEQIRVQKELSKAQDEYGQKTLGIQASIIQSALTTATTEQGIEEAKAAKIQQINADLAIKIQESKIAAAQVGLEGTAAQLAQEQALRDQALILREQAEAESDQRVLDAKTNAAIIAGDLSTQGGLKTLQFQKDIIDKQLQNENISVNERNRLLVKQKQFEDQITQQKLAATSQALGNLSTLMQTNSKELFAIGKAAAIADATIRGFQAFNLALATIPPPFGAIVGATSLAAAGVQIAKIASTNLATGITAVPAGFPNDSFSANLTSGERVVNVKQNQDLTSFLDNQKDGSSFGNSERMEGLLETLISKVDSLQISTVVNVGTKELMSEIRSAVRSGQQVLT